MEKVQLTILVVGSSDSIPVEIFRTSTVSELKQQLSRSLEATPTNIRLVHRRAVLADSTILAEAGLDPNKPVYAIKTKGTCRRNAYTPTQAPHAARRAGTWNGDPHDQRSALMRLTASRVVTSDSFRVFRDDPLLRSRVIHVLQGLLSNPDSLDEQLRYHPVMHEILNQYSEVSASFRNPEHIQSMLRILQSIDEESRQASQVTAGSMNYEGQTREDYGDQLAQLRELGFSHEDTNLQALQITHGDVSAAVEWLLKLLG